MDGVDLVWLDDGGAVGVEQPWPPGIVEPEFDEKVGETDRLGLGIRSASRAAPPRSAPSASRSAWRSSVAWPATADRRSGGTAASVDERRLRRCSSDRATSGSAGNPAAAAFAAPSTNQAASMPSSVPSADRSEDRRVEARQRGLGACPNRVRLSTQSSSPRSPTPNSSRRVWMSRCNSAVSMLVSRPAAFRRSMPSSTIIE